MRRLGLVLLVAVALLGLLGGPALAARDGVGLGDCVLLYPDGHYLAGQPLPLGFDPYGYNYQAHMFVGSYASTWGRRASPPTPATTPPIWPPTPARPRRRPGRTG